MKSRMIIFPMIPMVLILLTVLGVKLTAAQSPTTTTISTYTPNPTVGQRVEFTVNLKSESTGLSSKPVKIWHTFEGITSQDGTHETVRGVYSFTQAFESTGQRVYHAEFAGDSQYASSSGTVTVNVVGITTTTTISASNTNPPVGQTVTFTVNLNSNTLLNKPVKIWHTFAGATWEDGTHTTTSGVYTFTQAFGSTGQRIYHAEFAGDSQYASSSGPVTVNVVANPAPWLPLLLTD